VRVVTSLGLFMAATLVMTAILWVAWAGSRMCFGTTSGLTGVLAFSFLLALIICSTYWIVTRRKVRTARSFGRLVVMSALPLAAVTCIAHFVRQTPTRFSFLGPHTITLVTDPGVAGFLQSTYSFPGNPENVMLSAASELTSKGFKVSRIKGTLLAYVDAGGDATYDNPSISIGPGRVVGKHFVVDGDMVGVQKRNDWVTIYITEPDRVPDWIRALFP
jgi:hypothetical protein